MFFRRTPPIPGPQSIAAIESIEIGGIRQRILIRGENRNNPILLLLHGGPGSAQIGLGRLYFQELERDFVVVNWDQRGSGLSFSARIPPESMSIDRFVEDTRELAEMLLKRFGQSKLFLVGHSWGTILGSLTAARYPHLFHAYVGMGQVVAMDENEAVSYRYTLERARQRKHPKAIRDLERIGPPPYKSTKELGVQRRYLVQFGGAVHTGSVAGLFLTGLLRSTEYTLLDWITWVRGNLFSIAHLWGEVEKTDLRVQVPRLEMPVYILAGRYDYQTPHELAVSYYEQLAAPFKELIWFEHSAHLMVFEEPQTFARTMRKVLDDQGAPARTVGSAAGM